ncbi:MAG: hypothetical protein QFX35_05385 [Candidatus Verstraetearchaeota archaeon]|nr:hypothetical protein [Candidatus Verstraetearchaeota archaeon]
MGAKRDYREAEGALANLRVDGEIVPINEFVSRMLAGMISGAVLSLKGVREDWERIEIEIRRA